MMKDEKRPLFTFDDFLVLAGMVMLLTGVYLFDWRLALAAGGLLLILVGVARLTKLM